MKAQSEVWVTGIGIISALGVGFQENIDKLRTAKSPLKKLDRIHSVYSGQLMTGQIDMSDEVLSSLLGPDIKQEISRSSLLALIAAGEALKTGHASQLLQQISLVSASTVGGMSNTEILFTQIKNKKISPSADFIDQMDCGSPARDVIRNYKLGGENFTLSTACSSSSNAIMLGSRLIRSGKCKMVLTGGSDSLGKFVINGFKSLKNVDNEISMPFDADRKGLNLGEGAAFLLLEDSIHAKSRGANKYAVIKGWQNVNETYHMTGSSPEGQGANMAMTGALKSAGIDASEIGFIHAHGTGTIDNDLAENVAINKIFGNEVPFASSKPFTGHTLAASGVINTVLSIGMMKNNFIIPNLNFVSKMPETQLAPNTELIENIETEHCMINSFGFGGNNTSLIISKA